MDETGTYLARAGRDDEGCGLGALFMPIKALKGLGVGKTSSGEEEKWALLSMVFCALQLVPATSATGTAKASSELYFWVG